MTSITPRARYFSFIPWCVYDWQRREKGRSPAVGLRDAIITREKALVLGSVAHHDGKACVGGALVGSDALIAWFHKSQSEAELKKLPFAKYPAVGAYINSLVNLGFFLETAGAADSDDEEDAVPVAFDDLELSPLGTRLAEAYDEVVGQLTAVRELADPRARVSMRSLREFGKRGGFCELASPASRDRSVLRDIFFSRPGTGDKSHRVRKESLLLILELSRQLSVLDVRVGDSAFSSAVYFDQVVTEAGTTVDILWPPALADIKSRWRMFYFHHYMSVALEGMFAWMVAQASAQGLAGVSIDELIATLDEAAANRFASESCGGPASRWFGRSTPAMFFAMQSGGGTELNALTSRALDKELRASHKCAEDQLESILRLKEHSESQTGLAASLLLLGVTLARYTQWDEGPYGRWLAQAARDPYVDLVPPVLTRALSRRLDNWWTQPWNEIGRFVLSRYVVQQHQSMSYEKTAAGDRCLLQVEGSRIIASGSYDRIGMGNPRLRSALRILSDLALLRETTDGATRLTGDGTRLLDDELSKLADQ
ncbi:MAG: hypothetical protein H0W53_16775 [Acidobacteria bacterium]|nr:hypothetical protein [Acidobacteriota bacterium]